MRSFLFWMITSSDNVTEEIQPIQEEIEYGSRFSIALHLLLPVAGLIFVILRQKNFLNRLLLQLDRNCVSVICPSLSKRERLLKWATDKLPTTWSSNCKTLSGGVSELWSDGSLLCTLINTVIPGACPNPHRHWKKPPTHAQSIAYKYFGVAPVFTDEELSAKLAPSLESKFLHYLTELQQAVTKVTENKDSLRAVSAEYAPRGMGIFSGEQHRKTIFYIYLDRHSISSHNSTLLIQIRGPYGTYGKAVIPKFGRTFSQMSDFEMTSDASSSQKLEPKAHLIRMLSFMKYNKAYTGDNIAIDITIEKDRAKITYIPNNHGMYEINMIADGELLRGCPYNVHIFKNTSGFKDTLDLKKTFDTPTYSKRKVISKTIDLVNERMLLSELLEKYGSNGHDRENKIISEYVEAENVDQIDEIDEAEMANKIKISTIEEVEEHNELEMENNPEHSKIVPEPSSSEIKLLLVDRCTEETDISNVEKRNSPITFNEFNGSATNSERKVTQYNETQNECTNNDNAIKQNGITVTDSTILSYDTENETLGNLTNAHLYVYPQVIVQGYTDTTNVSKIQIPDKFKDNQNSSVNNIDSNKNELNSQPVQKNEDDYNNNISEDQTLLPQLYTLRHNISEALKEPEPVGVTQMQAKGSPAKFSISAYTSENPVNKISNVARNERIDHSLAKFITPKPFKSTVFLNLRHSNEILNSGIAPVDDNDIKTNKKNEETKRIDEQSVYQKNFNDVLKKFSIPSRFDPVKAISQNLANRKPSSDSTSPICRAHIALEVDYKQMSVEEKRKVFAQNSQKSNSTSVNSSFSENENAEVFKNQRHLQFEGLSVLNVISTLRQSQSASDSGRFSLSSTVSLPNISAIESEYTYPKVVKEKKMFWEGLTTRSSSSQSMRPTVNKRSERTGRKIWKKPYADANNKKRVDTDINLSVSENCSVSTGYLHHQESLNSSLPNISLVSGNSSSLVKDKKNFWEDLSSRSSSFLSSEPLPKKIGKLDENDRLRLIWNKPIKQTTDNPLDEKNTEIYRSADDILSMTDSYSFQSSKKYKSLDNSLDDCTVLSIEDRKRMLLQTNYEKEKLVKQGIPTRKKVPPLSCSSQMNPFEHEQVDKNVSVYVPPVIEKIRKFNSVSNIGVKTERRTDKEKFTRLTIQPETLFAKPGIRAQEVSIANPEKIKMKSHFRKAVKYFKNLEAKSLGKPKSKHVQNNSKKLGLNVSHQRRPKGSKKGGSLNLPKVSERFSINNLYEDVFGSRRGSFRGTPNRSALIEALATFPRKEKNVANDFNEDDIRFDIFKKSVKTRKRKSLKSVFNLYY